VGALILFWSPSGWLWLTGDCAQNLVVSAMAILQQVCARRDAKFLLDIRFNHAWSKNGSVGHTNGSALKPALAGEP